ncbi:MAG: hypothetical protein CTY16_02095 [Methylobacter sp.]|nr:MAG: hypothetical protein CTY16_02095 [Methylobacter sp.]
MVDFNRKRLQVFVSSTYTDLIDERQAAVEAILSHGHIPAGMELFTSGDESQMDVIKQWIEDSDVYLLILGGRYGSIEPNSGKSYTHLEYEYALELGKPYFACVVNGAAQERRVKLHGIEVTETENPKELKAFRQLVDSKIRKEWEDIKDIKIIVGETLGAFARRDDLAGWVRADQVTVNPAVAEEMARLSKENEQLRSQIANANPAEELINGLSFAEIKANFKDKQRVFEILDDIQHPYQRDEIGIGLGGECLRLHQLGMIKIESQCIDENEQNPLFSFTYQMTPAGLIFLNKLRTENLMLDKDS